MTAIIAIAEKTGVDMVWDGASYGHLRIDLTGASGGLVRIDDTVFEDVTNYFARDMMSVVDVRNYGAKGDGTTDDAVAFEAADAAANGRTILVSERVFKLSQDVTLDSKVKFEGTIAQPDDKRFILQKRV